MLALTLRPLASGRFVRSLASLKLAMLLLAVLIVACTVGTVAESRFDTTVAQTYIYDAPWFGAWLLLLCANLCCSVLVRYPWKPHQLGFIMTHAGIIILIAGAIVGRFWGVEGNVTLFKGAPPRDSLVVNQTLLQLRLDDMKSASERSVDIRLHPPTPAKPLRWKFADTQVKVLEYSERLQVTTTVEADRNSSTPGVQVQITGGMLPQPLDLWLVSGDPERARLNLGPLSLALADEKTAGSTIETPESLRSSEDVGSEAREKHFVFAKHPDMSVARSMSGASSGFKATYRPTSSDLGPSGSKGTLELDLEEQHFAFAVRDLIEKTVAIGETGWSVRGMRYLADFRLEGKEAVSVSDTPNNPAVAFELVSSGTGHPPGCAHDEKECGPGTKQPMACCADHKKPAGAPAPMNSGVLLSYQQNGKVRYATFSKGKKIQEGEAEQGSEFATGISNFKLALKRIVPNARLRQGWTPVSESGAGENLHSGLLVELERAGSKVTEWVAWGVPTQIEAGGKAIAASFNYRVQPLGFAIGLERFEVERNEGTQTPAGFKSHVQFTDRASGRTVAREIWMNHPATFPDFFGAGLWGTSYKFSQASWNPNDLSQTTLQVLRDPGWSLKWIGSLVMCAGLFVMFYLKPHRARAEMN